MDILGRLHFSLMANVVLNVIVIVVQGLIDIPSELNPGYRVIGMMYGTNNEFYYSYNICGGWSQDATS